jgi:aminoglycoside 3-N-acetyltransferase
MSNIPINEFKLLIYSSFKTNFEENGYLDILGVPDNFDLVESGILDSMDLLTLIIKLKEKFNITVDLSDIDPDFATTVNGLYQGIIFQNKYRTNDVIPIISISEWQEMLRELGVFKGDTLLVHSSLQNLGLVEEGIEGIFKGVTAQITDKGTILVPSANTQTFIHDQFDIDNTPVQTDLGMFSEFIRGQKDTIRSGNPFDSLCGFGHNAMTICGKTNTHGYDGNSPWIKALKFKTKLLLLGTSFYYASIVHAAETTSQVPYREWKKFTGKIIKNGILIKEDYYLYARPLGMKCHYERISKLPGIEDSVARIETTLGELLLVDLNIVYKSCVKILHENPDYFL